MKRTFVILSVLCATACGSIPSQEVVDSALGLKAPLVPKPLDVTALLADPCAAFPMIWKPLNAKSTGTDPGCKVTNDAEPFAISVIFYPKITNGLNRIYELHNNQAWKNGYFEPTTISGHPAVYAAEQDNRPDGRCDLNVAVTDQLFFVASAHTPRSDSACEDARAISMMVIERLRHTA